MSAEKASESHGATVPQPEAVPEVSTVGASDLPQRRLEKIHEYLLESLDRPDSFRANLGAVSGDLLWMALKLKGAIEVALSDAASPLGNFERLAPAIDEYLKVVRQIDRLGHLDQLVAGSVPRKPH